MRTFVSFACLPFIFHDLNLNLNEVQAKIFFILHYERIFTFYFIINLCWQLMLLLVDDGTRNMRYCVVKVYDILKGHSGIVVWEIRSCEFRTVLWKASKPKCLRKITKNSRISQKKTWSKNFKLSHWDFLGFIQFCPLIHKWKQLFFVELSIWENYHSMNSNLVFLNDPFSHLTGHKTI
jgi:hypothetical protein